MKNKIITIVLLLSVTVGCLAGCGLSKGNKANEKPDIVQVRSICDLATLECYYHNVAKSDKTAEKGITHLGEKDREFWVEYDGTVKLGIDMKDVEMSVEDKEIYITLPEAKVLSVKVNQDSYNKDSIISNQDGINKNKISADDITSAVNDAKDEMEKSAKENSSLLLCAQNRAKDLIENYITQVGDMTGVEYTINWNYSNDNSDDGDKTETTDNE